MSINVSFIFNSIYNVREREIERERLPVKSNYVKSIKEEALRKASKLKAKKISSSRSGKSVGGGGLIEGCFVI